MNALEALSLIGFLASLVTGLASLVVAVAIRLFLFISSVRFYAWKYGPAGILLFAFGSSTVWRMQLQVLVSEDPRVALDFKQAVKEESGMVAVAATILAQIAITALSLEKLNQTHWTARAFFIFSLVASIISVYYASKQYQVIGRRLTSDNIKAWIRRKEDPRKVQIEELPSIPSVLTISAPSALLSLSVHAFLAGLGVYLGFVWAKELDEFALPSVSKAGFITYIVSGVVCYSLYALSNTVGIGQTDITEVEFLRRMKASKATRGDSVQRGDTQFQSLESYTQNSLYVSASRSERADVPEGSTPGGHDEMIREEARIRRKIAALDTRLAQLLEDRTAAL